MRRQKDLPKSLGYRIFELSQSLQAIRDSLGAIRQGKLYQFIPLYGQLRALLLKSRMNEPLLLSLAKSLGQELMIYCMDKADPDNLPIDRTGLVFYASGFPLSLNQELPGQKMMSIDDFLDHKIIFFKDRYISTRKVIEWFANKAGGAHFDPRFPKDFMELLSIKMFGQPLLVNYLFQIGEICYKLGSKVLEKLINFEVYMFIYIPQQELKESAYIFDLKYPGLPMRIVCNLNPGMHLSFGVTCIQGISYVTQINRLINWNESYYICLSLFLAQVPTEWVKLSYETY